MDRAAYLMLVTGALLALFNPRDEFHPQARKFVRVAEKTRFVVTELIVSETVTRLRARACSNSSGIT